jgi:hypothetical protein
VIVTIVRAQRHTFLKLDLGVRVPSPVEFETFIARALEVFVTLVVNGSSSASEN